MSSLLIILIIIFVIFSYLGIKYFNQTKMARTIFGITFIVLTISVIAIVANEFLPHGLAGLFESIMNFDVGPANTQNPDDTVSKNNVEIYKDPNKLGNIYGNSSVVIFIETTYVYIDGKKVEMPDEFRETIKSLDLNNKEVCIVDSYASSKTMSDVMDILKEYYVSDSTKNCYDKMEIL